MIGVKSTNVANKYEVTLLTKFGNEEHKGMVLDWKKLFEYYDKKGTIPSMQLLDSSTDENIIHGTVDLNTGAPNTMILTVDADTLDATTLEPIHKIVDPESTKVEVFYDAQNGSRFMLYEEAQEFNMSLLNVGAEQAELIVKPGSIIEKVDGMWELKEVPGSAPYVVSHLGKNVRYKYSKELGWHDIVKAKYPAGFWRLGFTS